MNANTYVASDGTQIINKETIQLIEDVRSFCLSENVISIEISSEQQLQGAGELTKKLKKYERDLEAERVAAKKPVLEKSRLIDSTFAGIIEIVRKRVTALNNAIYSYQLEIKKAEQEEQRKRDEEARRERAKIEEEERKKREQEELRRKEAEEARRKAEEADNEEEKKRLEAIARKKETQADAAARSADIKAQTAAQVVAPVVEGRGGKVDGISTRKNWKARIIDKNAFMQWAARTERYEYLDINEANLNRLAKMSEDTQRVPGVEFYNDAVVSVRA